MTKTLVVLFGYSFVKLLSRTFYNQAFLVTEVHAVTTAHAYSL